MSKEQAFPPVTAGSYPVIWICHSSPGLGLGTLSRAGVSTEGQESGYSLTLTRDQDAQKPGHMCAELQLMNLVPERLMDNGC